MKATIQLNLTELLLELEESLSSGCLRIESESVFWQVYLQQGQVKYVYCSVQLLEQFQYYLHKLGFQSALTSLKELPQSYFRTSLQTEQTSSDDDTYSKVLSWLSDQKILNISQIFQLVEQISTDAFKSCLWLDKYDRAWRDGEPMPAWIERQATNCPSLKISESIDLSRIGLQKWQRCSEHLLSSHQRPYFSSGWENKDLPSSGSLTRQNLKELAKVLRGRTSIRQLSVLLKKDEIQVAQILSPYIENKTIYLREPQTPLDKLPSVKDALQGNKLNSHTFIKKDTKQPNNINVKTWKIVCIDDSPTILKEIQRFLNRDDFEVTAIDDPIKAVPTIFRIKPDLILLDITMPKINGYKLCGLLRNSKNCDNIPIIMVTGNTGFIDKARAKLAGATDYFTKPFTSQGLMTIVNKHLHQSNISRAS